MQWPPPPQRQQLRPQTNRRFRERQRREVSESVGTTASRHRPQAKRCRRKRHGGKRSERMGTTVSTRLAARISRRFQNPLAQYLKCRRLSSANASSKCVVVCTCGRSGHPTKPDHRPLLHNNPATAPFYHPCPCAVVSCHPAIPTQHPGWPCHPTVPAACLPSLPSVCDWVLIVGC